MATRIYQKLKPRTMFSLVCVLFGFLFITNGVPYVYSDGYCYFHIAKSIADHGTFASEVRPEYFDYRGNCVDYYNGKYIEVTAPGGALFLIPGLEIAKLFRLPSQSIYSDYFLAFNGHTLAEGIAVLVTAMAFALATIVLLYRTLRLWKFSIKISMLTTFAAYASSYAVWYVFLSPSFTHTYELFCVSLAMWAYSRFLIKPRMRELAIIGLSLGLAFLIRPIFAIFGVFIGFYLLYRKNWRGIFTLALGALPFGILWLIYNAVSYGSIFSSGYNVVRGETFDFSQFNGLNLLFAFERGWFIYSPVFVIAVIGLIVAFKKYRALAAVSLLGILSMVVIYGFWPAWWSGGGFGQRFMIVTLPFTTPGIAYLISATRNKSYRLFKWRLKLRIALLVLISLCTAWTLMLTLMYRFTPVAELRPKTDVVGKLDAANRYTPADIIGYQISLIKQSTGIADYIQHVYQSGNGGSSIAVILAGGSDAVIRLDERVEHQITLHLIYPPIGKPAIPGGSDAWLITADKQVFHVQLTLPATNYDYVLNCDLTCVSEDPMLIIQPASDFPRTLSKEGYVHLHPDNFNFDIYFAKPANMQIKGPQVNLPDGVFEYTLP